MVEINVYSDIANKKEGIWMSMFGIEDAVFSADTVKNLFSTNKSEKEFRFNIHCDGGSVSEGLAIYDIIRNSGKTIFTNIDGSCHSMAVTLLLAAPFENRTANRNARALIHQVQAWPYDSLNADELRILADEVEDEQNAILDIYEDRTDTDRETLENLMKEEKQRTAQELLDYGFISKINTYTTNKKITKMSKPKNQSLLNKAERFMKKVTNLLAKTMNYDFEDVDGNILFSTEADDDTLEVGMAASPDGTFELSDGTTVTIEGGEITEIKVPDANPEEIENLRAENAELRDALEEANEIINSLKKEVSSTYNVSPRQRVPGKNNNRGAKTAEERKNEAKEKLNKMRGKK